MAVKECNEKNGYPIDQSCEILKISRAAYYRWSTGELSPRTAENERIADLVEDIHEKHPEMGYRRLKDELDRRHNTHVNDNVPGKAKIHITWQTICSIASSRQIVRTRNG